MTATDPTLAALLTAVIARPDDDLPRLTMADWLEEHAGTVPCGNCHGKGDAVIFLGPGATNPAHRECYQCKGTGRVPDGRAERAEFIRVQVALALRPNLPNGCCHACQGEPGHHHPECPLEALRRRESELMLSRQPGNCVGDPSPNTFAAARYVWAGPAAKLDDPDGRGWHFRRGFVAEVTLPWVAWREHAAALLAATPLEKVVLTSVPDVALTASIDDRGTRLCRFVDEGQQYRVEFLREPGFAMHRIRIALLRHVWPGVQFDLSTATDRMSRPAGVAAPHRP